MLLEAYYRIKKGASLEGLDPIFDVYAPALYSASKVLLAAGQEPVITAGTDGKHSDYSMHYPTLERGGYALDIRSRDLPHPRNVAMAMAMVLAEPFCLVVENTHIHLQLTDENIKGRPKFVENGCRVYWR